MNRKNTTEVLCICNLKFNALLQWMFFKFDVNKIWSFKFEVAQLSPVSRVTQTQLPGGVEVKWVLLDKIERSCMLSLQFLLVQIVLYIEWLGIDIEDRQDHCLELPDKGSGTVNVRLCSGWLSQLLSSEFLLLPNLVWALVPALSSDPEPMPPGELGPARLCTLLHVTSGASVSRGHGECRYAGHITSCQDTTFG